MRLTARRSGSRLGLAFRLGFVPLSIGLLGAAAWVLAIASGVDWKGGILALLTILLILRTKVNPLILIAIGALAGLLGLV
jgi:chromate transporter